MAKKVLIDCSLPVDHKDHATLVPLTEEEKEQQAADMALRTERVARIERLENDRADLVAKLRAGKASAKEVQEILADIMTAL